MTFSKESSSSCLSDIMELDKQKCAVKMSILNMNLDDSEDELRVEDISSTSSFETSSDDSDFAEVSGAKDNKEKRE